MNHELLFTENTFQKTLVSSRNDAVSKNNRSAFGTDRAYQSDQQKFAEYLNANKNKSDTVRSKESSSDNNKVDAHAKANEAAKFATQKAKIHGEKTDVEDIVGFAGLDVDSITALQEEIQRLIAEQSDANGDETDAQTDTEAATSLITTDAETNDDAQSTDNLFALIASLLNESGEQKGVKESDGTNNNDFMALLGKIKDAVENGDIPSLTSGLTIEQLTALDENLDAYVQGKLSKEEEELLETLAAQWVTLAPPSTANAANKTSEEEARIKSDMAAALKQPKSDTANAKPVTAEERHYSDARYDARYSAEGNVTDNAAETSKADVDFKTTLKAESGQNTQAQQQTATNTNSAAERFLQSSGVLNALPADSSAQGSQAVGLTQAAVQGQANNPLTSVVTQSQNATQAHPATQLVSATIQKAVKAGEDTNIKLRLDPPELGRVEVKMSIDKDNVAKIVLTAEKPETFMMLQKDSHVLQQALNESGVDTQGDISFELASDNQDFGRDGNQQNGSHSSGRKSSDSEDGITMQTTMDWQVDPDTGHMRYNILA